jgi:Mononegavirales RNA dependent RNA polymerase
MTLWGNRIPIETKRYSRTTGCTNDQLPSVGLVLSLVRTLCLTVAQASESILEPIVMYTNLGIMCLTLLLQHDPAARIGLRHLVSKLNDTEQRSWWIKNLYLDTAPHFLIRGFPDPVTESLSFARNVALHLTDPDLVRSQLAIPL